MGNCRYLIFNNGLFCRLKGQNEPNCKKCSVNEPQEKMPESGNLLRGLRRIKIFQK
jgi:hypothetical protein